MAGSYLKAGTTELISVAPDGTQGNGDSSSPGVSDDGRLVAFHSCATNLIDPNTPPSVPPNSDCEHSYERDRSTGVTKQYF